MTTPHRVLLLAGEESGALYAREIAQRLRGRDPGVEIRGYEDFGFEIKDLAVMGFLAVLRRLFYFLRVRRTMERAIDTWKPDVVCTVDYPGMNLRLAAYAKSRGIRAVHVVCPQVWAWKAGRVPKIEASLSKLCCFFPFEPALFTPGFAEFVGHPLADAFAALARNGRGDPAGSGGRKTVALLPGSRMKEISAILPTMLDAVEGLDARFAVPAANEAAIAEIRRIVSARKSAPALDVRLGGAREVLLAADCAVVASGTATLEAALARCPTVLVYKVSRLFAAFLRMAVTGVKHAGLANIIWEKCGGADSGEEEPMPELLQEDFTSENVRRLLDSWLGDAKAREEAVRRLDGAVARLRSDGEAVERIAALLVAPEGGEAPEERGGR